MLAAVRYSDASRGLIKVISSLNVTILLYGLLPQRVIIRVESRVITMLLHRYKSNLI